jgi:hypothetical protein
MRSDDGERRIRALALTADELDRYMRVWTPTDDELRAMTPTDDELQRLHVHVDDLRE